MIARVSSALIAALLVLGLSACGARKEHVGGAAVQPVDLELDYLPNADHAGIYAALGAGDFARAGLQVRLHTPSDPAAPLKLLAAGKVDLAISYEPELLLARDKGLALVAVGALVQKPLTSIISLAPHAIAAPGQLAGKKIGTAGIPYQDAYLKTILASASVDASKVDSINVGFNLVPAMLSGRVDATLGAFWNVEGVELARRHKQPKILRVDTLGVPTYDELIIVARQTDVRRRGALIRRFMRALAGGQQRLRKNVDSGVDELVKENPDLDSALQRAEVKATLPVFFPAASKLPFGYQNPADWNAYAQWMFDHKLLDKLPDASRAYTNEFLPGQGI